MMLVHGFAVYVGGIYKPLRDNVTPCYFFLPTLYVLC